MLPDLQSAYRAHHSTETVLHKVLGDILLAAFDSVDHDTLLRHLWASYGLDGAVLD